nr:hypothetical protein [Tanacetum cinerariifolium]
MSSTFADTHNMVSILTKSDASECFDQIIDFLNGSYIQYALTVNPHIYVSCIKQFWNTVTVKQSADVTRKFNFSKYIFDSLVKNVDSSSMFYMYHRVGKGFLGVETPLFEGMLVVKENMVEGIADEQVQDDVAVTTAPKDLTTAVEEDIQAQLIPLLAPPTSPPPLQDIPYTSYDLEITKLKTRVKNLERANKVKPLKPRRLRKVGTFPRIESSDDTIMKDIINQGRMIDELDRDEGIELMGEKEEKQKDIANDDQAEVRHAEIQAEKQAEIYQIGMVHAAKVLSMHEEELTEVHEVVEVVTTAKLITKVVTTSSAPVSATSTIIPAVELNIPAATITAAPVKVAATFTRQRKGVVIRDLKEESIVINPVETKDKGKGILVEEPKPIKKKQHIQIDEAYARKLLEELNQDIDWDTEAQDRRNMIMYLKNTAELKLDYFKGKSCDDIRPIFKAKLNTNMEFLLKSKDQIEEEENRALESINETLAQKAAKRRRLNQEDKDVEEIKQHLEIVPDKDYDIYTEATPLAKKVLVVDYQIIHLNNKPRYKIIRADETYQLTMFGRQDGQANVWKSQRSVNALELMLPRSLKKNTKYVNAAGEELSVVKHKLMLLNTAAKRS